MSKWFDLTIDFGEQDMTRHYYPYLLLVALLSVNSLATAGDSTRLNASGARMTSTGNQGSHGKVLTTIQVDKGSSRHVTISDSGNFAYINAYCNEAGTDGETDRLEFQGHTVDLCQRTVKRGQCTGRTCQNTDTYRQATTGGVTLPTSAPEAKEFTAYADGGPITIVITN